VCAGAGQFDHFRYRYHYVGQRIIAALRKDLGEKVLSAPIGQIEGYRSHRLIPVLTHDVDTISDFSFAFTPLAIAATVTLGCLGYLAYLSVPMFLMMVVAIVIGSAVQFIAGGRASRASTWRATMRMSCSALQRHRQRRQGTAHAPPRRFA
jgi:ABC-type siderophore export system fused ATPase/permease subunit